MTDAPRRPKGLPVYPTRSQVHRIVAACENERDAWLIRLLWHTGARISEVLQARVGDVTASGLKLPNLKQRGPAQKHVFLPPDFLAELRAYCGGRALDVPIVGRLIDGKPMSRKRGWQIVTKAGAAAGVLVKRFGEDRLRPPWCHSYRHGNAVHLLESAVPVNAVSEQLGHSSLSSTAVYLKLADPHRQKMIEAVKF